MDSYKDSLISITTRTIIFMGVDFIYLYGSGQFIAEFQELLSGLEGSQLNIGFNSLLCYGVIL